MPSETTARSTPKPRKVKRCTPNPKDSILPLPGFLAGFLSSTRSNEVRVLMCILSNAYNTGSSDVQISRARLSQETGLDSKAISKTLRCSRMASVVEVVRRGRPSSYGKSPKSMVLRVSGFKAAPELFVDCLKINKRMGLLWGKVMPRISYGRKRLSNAMKMVEQMDRWQKRKPAIPKAAPRDLIEYLDLEKMSSREVAEALDAKDCNLFTPKDFVRFFKALYDVRFQPIPFIELKADILDMKWLLSGEGAGVSPPTLKDTIKWLIRRGIDPRWDRPTIKLLRTPWANVIFKDAMYSDKKTGTKSYNWSDTKSRGTSFRRGKKTPD